MLVGIMALCYLTANGQEEQQIIEHEGNKYTIHVDLLNPDPEMLLLDVLHLCPEFISADGHDILDDQGDIEHSAGDTYLMKPDDDGHLSIDVRTNSFKPYIGAGYEIGLQKNKDKWKLAIDAGLLFWGGAPSMRVSSDGINLLKDIDNIPGKKGDYIKKVKKLVVYPNISVSLVHHIF